jgi:hypothetical protein
MQWSGGSGWGGVGWDETEFLLPKPPQLTHAPDSFGCILQAPTP